MVPISITFIFSRYRRERAYMPYRIKGTCATIEHSEGECLELKKIYANWPQLEGFVLSDQI